MKVHENGKDSACSNNIFLQKRNVVITCITFVYLSYIMVKCPFKSSVFLVSIKHSLGLNIHFTKKNIFKGC